MDLRDSREHRPGGVGAAIRSSDSFGGRGEGYPRTNPPPIGITEDLNAALRHELASILLKIERVSRLQGGHRLYPFALARTRPARPPLLGRSRPSCTGSAQRFFSPAKAL